MCGVKCNGFGFERLTATLPIVIVVAAHLGRHTDNFSFIRVCRTRKAMTTSCVCFVQYLYRE